MPANKDLWFDVDGVLLDYTRPFLASIKSEQTYETLNDYDLNKLFTTRDECLAAMTRFSDNPDFALLPKIVDTALLEQLKAQGFRLKIITKLPDVGQSRAYRHQNLSRDFKDLFDDVVFTHNECKLDVLEGMTATMSDEEVLLIEDNPWLLEKADVRTTSPVRVYAIKHPYNATVVDHLRHIPVYNNTDDCLRAIIGEQHG